MAILKCLLKSLAEGACITICIDSHAHVHLLGLCVCTVCMCVFLSYSGAEEAVSAELAQQRPPCGVQ